MEWKNGKIIIKNIYIYSDKYIINHQVKIFHQINQCAKKIHIIFKGM